MFQGNEEMYTFWGEANMIAASFIMPANKGVQAVSQAGNAASAGQKAVTFVRAAGTEVGKDLLNGALSTGVGYGVTELTGNQELGMAAGVLSSFAFGAELDAIDESLNISGLSRPKGLPKTSNRLNNIDKSIENSMYRKKKSPSVIEPMPKHQLQKIVKAFKRKGGIIQMDDATDAYLKSKHAEAITYDEKTILLRQNPGRASVYEELIHATQYRRGLNDGSVISRIQNEISAQEKLLRNSKAYKLTPEEIKQTEAALASYIAELQKLLGGK